MVQHLPSGRESSLPLFVFSETLPVITAVSFRHKPRFRAPCIYIYKTRTRGMSCAVQMVQPSHSRRSVLVFGTIVQPVKGVFGAMPTSDGKNEYMTRKAPIKTAARASPLARAGLFWRIWANASWESRRPFLTPSAPSLYQTSPPRAIEYPKNCRGATGSWKMTMDATTRRISLSTPERVSTTAEVLPICTN